MNGSKGHKLLNLFANVIAPLTGDARAIAERTIIEKHYAHCFPSGKSHVFEIDGAIVVYSIPANKNIGPFLLGREANVWELTRLWAPDGHEKNLLTRAISVTIGLLRIEEPKIECLVSYADPNAGHHGGVYRAASWLYHGRSKESRYYVDASGQVVARRKFHSGSRCLRKHEILALGFRELKREGKHRFARPLTRRAKRELMEVR